MPFHARTARGHLVKWLRSTTPLGGSRVRSLVLPKPKPRRAAKRKKGLPARSGRRVCNSRGTCWSVSRVGMERHRDGRPHGWFDARAPRLLSKPGQLGLCTRLRCHGEQRRGQRIGLRNGTASRNVEPEIDPFKGVVLLNHFTKWPRVVMIVQVPREQASSLRSSVPYTRDFADGQGDTELSTWGT